MMTRDEQQIVSEVYSKFVQSEHLNSWDDLDDSLCLLESLTNVELANEAQVLFDTHSTGNVRCKLNHSPKLCMVPMLMEAVAAILKLWNETGMLHIKNKYVFQYYLALSHVKFIVLD